MTLLGRWPASLLQHNLSMLLLANLNFSPCYFSFELLQIVMRKGRVHPRISYEMAPPALSQPPTSGTLYLAKKGCLPPVISISSSRSSMQRTGRPVLREASEGQKPGGLHTSPALWVSEMKTAGKLSFAHWGTEQTCTGLLCCLGTGLDKVGNTGRETCPCLPGPHSQVREIRWERMYQNTKNQALLPSPQYPKVLKTESCGNAKQRESNC